MTSTQETWRERIAPASPTASIITMSDGRIAAETGCGMILDAVVTAAPAKTKTSRRFNSDRFELSVGFAMAFLLFRANGCPGSPARHAKENRCRLDRLPADGMITAAGRGFRHARRAALRRTYASFSWKGMLDRIG